MSNQEQKVPSKEEIIAFLKEQIEVKTLQVDLQKLNTEFAIAKAEELKALSFVAQMNNPKPNANPYEGGVHHKLTQDDLDENPEFAKNGLKVGDEVVFPNDNTPLSEDEEKEAIEEIKKKDRSLKKDK